MKKIFTLVLSLLFFQSFSQKSFTPKEDYSHMTNYINKTFNQISTDLTIKENFFSCRRKIKGDTTIYIENLTEKDTMYRMWYCVKDTCIQANTYLIFPSYINILIDKRDCDREYIKIDLWIPRTPEDIENIIKKYRELTLDDQKFLEEYKVSYAQYLVKEKTLQEARRKPKKITTVTLEPVTASTKTTPKFVSDKPAPTLEIYNYTNKIDTIYKKESVKPTGKIKSIKRGKTKRT